MEKRLNVLISNDDGYFAPGIRTLARRIAKDHNVVVVAPKWERSGYAHMVNFFGGITYEKVEMADGIETYAVDGSPADCVIFAIKHLFTDRKFDVVISGINSVLNIGSDVMYSGTFGAAEEGTFHRIPSIAVSLRTRHSEKYDFSADFIAENLLEFIRCSHENVTLNVNIPSTEREDILGVRVAPITYRPYEEKYEYKYDRYGTKIYYVVGKPDKSVIYDENGDCALSEKGYITVTPIQMICTDYEALEDIKRNSEFKL